MDIDNMAANDPVGGLGSEHIKDSSTGTFMEDVVEASTTTPVIVDFWAPWCGPCKQLGPVLEKVVTEAGGAVKLVKVDIDENPEIAQQLRVQSIPAVFAFKNGQPVDGFAGALPESQIREFVKKLTGGAAGESPVAEALEAAESLLNEENYDAASGLFKQILQHDPSSTRGLAGLCKTLVALNNLDDGKVVSWHIVKKDTHGYVKIVASYPHGSGYCRVVFTQIQKKGNARDFKETACKDVSYRGWQFIR